MKVATEYNPTNSMTKSTSKEESRRDYSLLMGSPISEWEMVGAPKGKAMATISLMAGMPAPEDMLFSASDPPISYESEYYAYDDGDDRDLVLESNDASPPAPTVEIGAGMHEDDLMVDPDGACMASRVAGALKATTIIEDNESYEMLHCFIDNHNSCAFVAITKDGGLSVLTGDGIVSMKEPESWTDVMTSPQKAKWLESMQIEHRTFKDSNTYRLVPITSVPKGTRIFRLSWKYKIKRNADLTLDKFKSRCVLMGNFMRKGRDFTESFAVGARLMSVKMVYAITAVYDWEDFLLDIKGAYLLVDKPESGIGSMTHVHQPRGFEEVGPNGEKMVGVLNTYVYGDPEAGRAWMYKFDGVLKTELGAEADDVDPNLFRADGPYGRVIFAKHVDELIGAAENEAARKWVHETISAKLEVGAFTRWSTVLGFGVTRDRKNRTVKIDAERLIRDVAKKRGVAVPDV